MDLDLTSPIDLLALRRQAEILAGVAEAEGRVYRAEALRGLAWWLWVVGLEMGAGK